MSRRYPRDKKDRYRSKGTPGKRREQFRIGTPEFREWWDRELAITRRILREREEEEMKLALGARFQFKVNEMRQFLDSAGITIEDARAVLNYLSEPEETDDSTRAAPISDTPP